MNNDEINSPKAGLGNQTNNEYKQVKMSSKSTASTDSDSDAEETNELPNRKVN